MKYLLFLLLPVFTQGQAIYDPADKLVKMPIEMAARLDSLARLGKVCSESIDEAEIQLEALIKNKEYNTKMIQTMQSSIMFAQQSLSVLEEEIIELQVANSVISRQATTYKSELDYANKKAKQDMWGKLALGGGVALVAVAVIVNSLTPRR